MGEGGRKRGREAGTERGPLRPANPRRTLDISRMFAQVGHVDKLLKRFTGKEANLLRGSRRNTGGRDERKGQDRRTDAQGRWQGGSEGRSDLGTDARDGQMKGGSEGGRRDGRRDGRREERME